MKISFFYLYNTRGHKMLIYTSIIKYITVHIYIWTTNKEELFISLRTSTVTHYIWLDYRRTNIRWKFLSISTALSRRISVIINAKTCIRFTGGSLDRRVKASSCCSTTLWLHKQYSSTGSVIWPPFLFNNFELYQKLNIVYFV